MGEETEFEILPHEELEKLRHEVADIKKNPLGDKYDSQDLIDAIHRLTDGIEGMNDVFKSTNQEMIDDFSNHSLKKNFEMLSSQNEEIARGILSVAQLVETQLDVMRKISERLDNHVNYNTKANEVEGNTSNLQSNFVVNAENVAIPENINQNLNGLNDGEVPTPDGMLHKNQFSGEGANSSMPGKKSDGNLPPLGVPPIGNAIHATPLPPLDLPPPHKKGGLLSKFK